jgi:hypothetical protein
MSEDPQILVEQVRDEASLLRFIAALKDDWYEERAKEHANPSSPHGPGANGWENGTIGAFLDAALRWAEDTRLDTSGSVVAFPENPWRRIACVLLAGKSYE